MSEEKITRPRLGPRATKLAESLTGAPTSEGLEAGILALEMSIEEGRNDDAMVPLAGSYKSELEAIHESLCIIQLMLLESVANSPAETQRTLAEFARFTAKRQRSALLKDDGKSKNGDMLDERLLRTEQIEIARDQLGPDRTKQSGRTR